MRKAVVRVDADPGLVLTAAAFTGGIGELRASGVAVQRRHGARDLTLTFDDASRDGARTHAAALCEKAFGTAPVVGAVTFASRGTDEDALGVVAAFGVDAELRRFSENDEEVAEFTISAADRERVPESRLHTALEAALNCEIRIRYA